ncbi:hypothetical protein [Pantoea brenneri]|nr:hypothetical protein [Pantoea brenneri]MDH1085923.1 hypothetical protein [Pantoea brenneri]
MKTTSRGFTAGIIGEMLRAFLSAKGKGFVKNNDDVDGTRRRENTDDARGLTQAKKNPRICVGWCNNRVITAEAVLFSHPSIPLGPLSSHCFVPQQ